MQEAEASNFAREFVTGLSLSRLRLFSQQTLEPLRQSHASLVTAAWQGTRGGGSVLSSRKYWPLIPEIRHDPSFPLVGNSRRGRIDFSYFCLLLRFRGGAAAASSSAGVKGKRSLPESRNNIILVDLRSFVELLGTYPGRLAELVT